MPDANEMLKIPLRSSFGDESLAWSKEKSYYCTKPVGQDPNVREARSSDNDAEV
jgi:hypothetical protein